METAVIGYTVVGIVLIAVGFFAPSIVARAFLGLRTQEPSPRKARILCIVGGIVLIVMGILTHVGVLSTGDPGKEDGSKFFRSKFIREHRSRQ